jgi:predicted O-methyltransferase YrrM
MWFKIKAFIRFLLQSSKQHGIHSPFVFDFISNCFYKKANEINVATMDNIRKIAYQNQHIIETTDYGKGSRVFKTNKRKIADIAKIAGMNKKKSTLLLNIIAYFQPKNILEIGTSVGLGSATLSIGNPDAKIITLEGCPNTANAAQKLFNMHNLTNIELVIGNFHDTLSPSLNNKQIDLIYIDGNHQKKPTLQYFNECISNTHNNSLIIFDDINWSTEMQEAWYAIKKHPRVTISIDTFFWGIVFFKKSQEKQHFKIRC